MVMKSHILALLAEVLILGLTDFSRGDIAQLVCETQQSGPDQPDTRANMSLILSRRLRDREPWVWHLCGNLLVAIAILRGRSHPGGPSSPLSSPSSLSSQASHFMSQTHREFHVPN
jgi:hypothetical protein